MLLICSALFLKKASAQSSYLDQLIQQAQSKKLWENRAWQKLLFIPDKPLSFRKKSLITNQNYFFAEDGRTNPEHELLATLNAFFGPPVKLTKENPYPPQCQYAARFYWLSKELNIDPAQVKIEPCPMLHKFLDGLDYSGVSLVFSNYFSDAPASLFGHTFLRLHRQFENHSESPLLDDIANFAANVPPQTNMLLYPIFGLTGGYKGIFTVMPYYTKLQEYNNHESRDLWEYELNLNQEELKMLELVLWEVGWSSIDYYYADDNCSYVMLSLLEAAAPRLALSGKLLLYAVPADTIRVVYKVPNLVKNVRYRPSVLSRYLARYSLLTDEQADGLTHLLVIDKERAKSPKEILKGFEPKQQAQIIDTALEYIDYKEKLVGSNEPVQYAKLRTDLLVMRAESGQKFEPLPDVQYSTPPHTGHNSGLISFSMGSDLEGAGSFSEFRWRPVLHDLEASANGYSNALGISFLDTVFRYQWRERNFYVHDFRALEITKNPTKIPTESNSSLHLSLGYEKQFAMQANGGEGRYFAQLGKGLPFYFFKQNVMLFDFLQFDMGYAKDFHFHIGPSLLVGGMAQLWDWGKIIIKADFSRRFMVDDWQEKVDSVKMYATMSGYFSPDFEGRLQLAEEEKTTELSIGIQYYF